MRKIREVGITKYLPFVVKKKTAKDYQAQFAIDAKEIQVQDSDGNWKSANELYPNKESVIYTVHIGGGINAQRIPIQRDGISDEIKVFVHDVTFSNDATSMSNLRANVGFVVFSTVARILHEFAITFPDKFQCFHFTPANDRLIPVYEILSKESEKQSTLVYANKSVGKERRSWYLLNQTLWNKYKKIKGIE